MDEYISEILKRDLPGNSICIKARGPLITPDLLVLRSEICKGSTPKQLENDLSRIIAVEVRNWKELKAKK